VLLHERELLGWAHVVWLGTTDSEVVVVGSISCIGPHAEDVESGGGDHSAIIKVFFESVVIV